MTTHRGTLTIDHVTDHSARIDADVSAREAEVLALVGARLSNAEIARRLFISVRTVESHVSSLLRKLGAADRRELANLAASSGPSIGGYRAATLTAAEAETPVRYAQRDGLNIAYQVTGTGPVDLVLVAGFVSHLTLDWTERRHAHFLHRLGTFSRLIRFDKRGTGMSDRPGALPDLETRMGDVAAVMDAVRSEHAVLFGYSEGGPMSILYAASHPERVKGLVLYSSHARRLWAHDYPWGARPEDRARYAAQTEHDWAWEADLRQMCPSADDALARWWGQRCRAAISPGAARALIEMNSLVDVREALSVVQAPTLVLHRRHDTDSRIEEGRYLADHIAGAQFIELDGADHFVAVDPDQILDPVEEFVLGLESSTPTLSALTTLMVLGVEEQDELTRVREILQGVLPEYHGVPALAENADVLATFDGPVRATRCGLVVIDRASAAGLHVSVGLHTAEVVRHGATVSGAGVVVAQAVAERAPCGEIWATSTLRDLTAGSGMVFETRATMQLPYLGRRVDLVAPLRE